MSVPPTPGNQAYPGETPPASSAPHSDDHTMPSGPAQSMPPNATPRTTARPQSGTPPFTPTYPPQQDPTQPPAPTFSPPSAGESPAYMSHDLMSQSRWQRPALTAVAVLMLVVLCMVGFSLYATHEAQQPALAAQAFCRDLQTKQYGAAYDKLSSAYQAKTSQEQFVEEAGLHDQVDGPVTNCAVLRSSAPKGFTLQLIGGATLVARIIRHKPLDGTITVIKQGTDWKVENIGSSLQGTTLAPLRVGMTFCKALVAKDYATAYSTFSSRERSGGTESAFAATFTKAFGADQQLTRCTPTLTSYVVSPQTNSATVDVALQITLHVQGNGQVTIPATIGFVTESDAWKLDSIAIKSA